MTEQKKEITLQRLNTWGSETMLDTLEIRFTDISEDSLTATMPVSPRVHQPMGLLHGGATAALAETLGSTLSFLHIDQEKQVPVGTNLSCNHLRSATSGMVTGVARFIRKGNTMHVSEIMVKDENDNLISHIVMTNNIITKP